MKNQIKLKEQINYHRNRKKRNKKQLFTSGNVRLNRRTWNLEQLVQQYYRKIHCLTREFHLKFHLKNRYRDSCDIGFSSEI